MHQYTEQDLLAALDDVKNGMLLKVASQEWGIFYSIIQNRNQGSKSHSLAAESQQRLSKVQEDHLFT